MAGNLIGRLTIAAALVGASWYLSKRAEDRARQEYVNREIGKREAKEGRSLTPQELAGMIDFYSSAFDAQRAYQRSQAGISGAAPAKTLR